MNLSVRQLSRIAGFSYVIIFFAAIFANFFVVEEIKAAPMAAIQEKEFLIRLGIIAFLITVVFDVVVAWALHELYRENRLSGLSTLFRMMHAAIMAVAVFSLLLVFQGTNAEEVLGYVSVFNNIWLIGLFFFGIHLILLAQIIKRPVFIIFFLILAGVMYVVDTSANFLISDYSDYASYFLAMVALPSILGEMSLAVWLILKARNQGVNT